MRSHLLAPTCVGLLALGCGGGSTSQPAASSAATEPTNANEAAPTPTSPPPSSTASAFEVHEWGFVDVPLTGPTEIGAGPGQPAPDVPMIVRKPVIYVHADPGTTTPPLDVQARFPSGELLEVWPTQSEWPGTRSDAASIHWTGLTLAACDGSTGAAGFAPTQREARACATVDGYCEVNDLPTYATSDATCLVSNGVSAPLLFYRGRTSSATLPLRVTDAGGTVRLESSADGGSSILHVRDWLGSETTWPARGASVTTPAERTLDRNALASRLSSMLVAAGLTQPEADAFLRAWSTALFQVPWPTSDVTRDVPARRGPSRALTAPPAPYLLYILPEASVPALAELTITPTPRTVRRVMVVRVELAR